MEFSLLGVIHCELKSQHFTLLKVNDGVFSKHAFIGGVGGDLCCRLVNSDIEKEIREHCGETETAFAHCISANFGHNKHMSQGVATVVGKPTAVAISLQVPS